jgi:hypothetical protein
MKKTLLICGLLAFNYSISQTVSDLINAVDIDELTLTLNEFSGEVTTVVDGNTVTILNRVSNSDNNLAADYLIQKFNAIGGLTVTDDIYTPGATGGRNIIATQLGVTNPDNIYIICAHYDSVANYCADDNVSGTAAVLEIARILSQYDIDNTIVYALWDQEELGLIGANNYAEAASANGDNILAVFNMDMMAHDGDGDNDFDIDVRPIANSIAMKDDIIALLGIYGVSNDIDLNVNVVNPGTPFSDHKPFWDEGYTALLFGEAWSNGDQTEDYHTAGDRVSTLDLDYYHDMVKLAMAYMGTKAGLNSLSVEDSNSLKVQVYPSPTNGFVNIKLSEAIETQVNITDIHGKQQQETVLVNQENRLDVSALSSGIYFIQLLNDQGERTVKFIKD